MGLEAVLKQSDNYENLKKSQKMIIILHSCNAASGKNSFAQNVSMEKGRTVIAADSYTLWNSSGQVGSRQNRADDPNPDLKGSWLIYAEGVLVGAYDEDWNAASPPSKWDDFLYKKEITYVTNVSKGSHLNIRTKPKGEVIGTLSRGQVVDFTGNVDMEWMEVSVGSQKGWVSSNYIEAQYSGKKHENTVEKQKEDL